MVRMRVYQLRSLGFESHGVLIFSTFLHFDIKSSLSDLLRRCISTYVATTTKSIPSCVAWGEAILIQHGKKVIIPVNEGFILLTNEIILAPGGYWSYKVLFE